MDFKQQNNIEKRIKYLKSDGIKYISGTVAPAESDRDTNDIESLERALAYFVNKGVYSVHIQPKWMGSRCQFYLFRDNPEKNFAVSRNGYKIRNVDLAEVFTHWMHVFDVIQVMEPTRRLTEVILDGELLPWNLIGNSLIEREFNGLLECVETELQFLDEMGLNSARNIVAGSDEYIAFIGDVKAGLTKNELQKKYPRHETYANFDKIQVFNYDEERNDLDAYREQLNIYGASSTTEFKAFDILRVDFEDGSFRVDDGWLGNTFTKYVLVNTRNYNSLERYGFIAEPTDVEGIRNYMNSLVNNGYEGIMIKPRIPSETDAIHCMKVRNKEYLRIIYGYNYQRPENLDTLVRKKHVGKKRKISHQEYKLGKEMLKLDWNDIDFEEKYDKITKALLFEIDEEATLDNRL